MAEKKKKQVVSRNGTVTVNQRIKKSISDSVDAKYEELRQYCIAQDIDTIPNKGVFISIILRESPVLTSNPEEILNKVR